MPEEPYIAVRDEPGLGINVDWDALGAHPYRRDNMLELFTPEWERRKTQEAPP